MKISPSLRAGRSMRFHVPDFVDGGCAVAAGLCMRGIIITRGALKYHSRRI